MTLHRSRCAGLHNEERIYFPLLFKSKDHQRPAADDVLKSPREKIRRTDEAWNILGREKFNECGLLPYIQDVASIYRVHKRETSKEGGLKAALKGNVYPSISFR